MLLCVAGGGSSGFNRDRSREGSRCSAQSIFTKNNTNSQGTVEQRCSMSSATVNVPSHSVSKQESICPRASRNVHSKHNESSLAYRGKVIVVRGEDSAVSETAENSETCSTTTTFKSNIVNGKRSTNTILVRYKPSKTASALEDDLQIDLGNRCDSLSLAPVSSSSSTISNESTSSGKKDKASTSAWAQIMELEGYRSPAIGLDNLPKRNNEGISDDENADYCVPNVSSHIYSPDNPNNCSSVKCSDKNCYYSKSCNEERKEDNTNDPIYVNNDFNREVEEYKVYVSHEPEPSFVAHSGNSYCSETKINSRPNSESFNKSQATQSEYTSDSAFNIPERSLPTCTSVPGEQNCIKIAQKVKSPMYRSESSRTCKSVQEKNKSRRKTLPDGSVQMTDKYNKSSKKHLSPEHDPNASWGRYNSRAMRDSVRKVAQKYAETVYLRRQTHSRLDALPEVKGIQLTRYVSPYNSQNHVHSNSNFQNSLYCSRVPNVASHLHELPHEPVSMISNRRKLHLLVPKSTHHDHNMLLHDYLWNCPHKKGDKKYSNFEKQNRVDEAFSNLFKENHIENDSISSNSDKCSSKNSQLHSSDDSECLCCDTGERDSACICKFNCSNCRDTSERVRPKFYKSPKCKLHFDNILNIEDSNLRSNEGNAYFSDHMRDIKSKLCIECAQSAESGPPSKQSASRTNCSKTPLFFSSNTKLCSSALKAMSPTNNSMNIPQHVHLRGSNEKGSTCRADSTSKCCTMLTAREMADLVHGSKLNDYKLPHVSVTNKVTSWIQKQKEKRKPVFFIGDSPAFFSSSNKECGISEKQINRKSKRSLSLSSVREDDISINCKVTAESTLNLLAVQVNPSGDDGDNDHKNLYIKRASSSCSNRGSVRRKIRQGSPVREEKVSVTKNFDDHLNQVDGCIASLNNRYNNKAQSVLYLNSLATSDQNNPNYDEHITPKTISNLQDNHSSYEQTFSLSAKKKNINTTDIPEINDKHESRKQNFVDGEGYFANECSKFSSLDDSCRNLNTLKEIKPERLSFSKRLLNIKQLTRALSLHSLKKKTKESEVPVQKLKNTGNASSQFSKWTRSSKRKVDGSKYGSLRKSLSYCELTIREANISSKSKLPIKSRTEIKTTSKPSARTSVPFTISVCCCSTTLKRSVSLYGNFPLSRLLDNSWDEPKSDTLARLCFSRLYRRNGVPPFVRQLKNQKVLKKMKGSDGTKTVLEKPTHHLDSPKPERAHRVPIIVLKSEDEIPSSKNESRQNLLNSNEETSSKPDVIMGLGNNHALNDASNCSSLKMVEEFIPFEHSTKTMENHQPLTLNNKSKVPAALRLRNRATSRSERHAKGKSTSELCGRSIRKTVSDALDSKKRPTSQFYDLDEIESRSDSSNGPNLLHINAAACGSQPILSVPEVSPIPKISSFVTRHSSLHTSTPQLSPADSLLQRFRKSFALRFQKKKPEPILSVNSELLSTTIEISELSSSNSSYETKVLSLETNDCVQNNCHSKSPQTVIQNLKASPISSEIKASPHCNSRQRHPCFIDGRKKSRRKPDRRLSLIYDSVDSIFDSATKSLNKYHGKPNFTGSDANILRKRAASTSDYSPKSKAIQRPVSVADYLTLENSCTKVSDGQNDLTRTASDTTSSDEQQKNLTSLDQIWRANPVKLCRVHSRLLMCRHKGRYRLRRSISQPVELEMTGSIHNLRDSSHGSADHESFQKGSLSSDDEASSESDIYHSYCCSPTRRSNTCWEPSRIEQVTSHLRWLCHQDGLFSSLIQDFQDKRMLSGDGTMYAEALWDHETIDSEELPFQAGDIIEVTDTSDQDWWWGSKDGHGGWFPSAFVRLFVSHRSPSLHFNGESSEGIQIPYSPCKSSMNNLSCEQVRANIVQEIVATERDYVKHLKDVVEGYLKQVHRRPDMFSKERIETVFGNIKEIYSFQSQFLKQLEDCLVKDAPHLSQIGNCFLNHKEEFKMYSQYCNNHPLAVNELQELYCDSQYIHFFEACRLLQEMIDISLDGFLLTPIQRICKYPLQLAELLKFTDANHHDHVPVTNALAAMKEVAELVNERKRRMECLERIAEWQNTIEGWEGPDVLDTSSILIHCGEVTRVSSSWSRDIYLFIFDHQLIYCKKDLLKRHTYAYKGRLNLDHCDIVDVEDGKDSQFAVNLKNAWKIYCKDKEKWYLFYAKTSPEKDQWLRAFKAERQRVVDDEKQGFVVTEEAKRSARLAMHNKQKPKRPRAKFTKGRRCHPDVAVTELLLDSPSAKARSGSLPSNIHPELAIMAGAKLGPTRKKGSGWFHFGSGKKPKS